MEIVRFVEVDGVWHELTDEQDETVCGLDFDLYAQSRESAHMRNQEPAEADSRCRTCFAKD